MAAVDGLKRYEPPPRLGHATASVGHKVYLWGGWQKGLPSEHTSPEKTRMTSVVNVFDLQTGEWDELPTSGTPPLGVRGYSCASVGHNIYYFGGWCGHDWCRHHTVHRLDTQTMSWHEVKVDNPNRAPMKKNSCGMVAFKDGEEDLLFVCNGAGLLCTAAQAEALYIPWKENPDYGWSNEIHLFSLNDGAWSRPEVTGEIPPPSAGFTLTKISNTKALFYGGFNPETGLCVKEVYVAELSKETVHWYKLASPHTTKEKLPRNRNDHAVVCIAGPMSGHTTSTAFMLGGRDHKWASCNDCWVLDCHSGTWSKVVLPDAVSQRHFHAMSAFYVNLDCVWVVLIGGVMEWMQGRTVEEQPVISNTTVIELCKHDKQWTVGCVLDNDVITCTEQYKTRLISKLLDSTARPVRGKPVEEQDGKAEDADAYITDLQLEIETITAGLTDVTHRARLAETRATNAEKKETEALEVAEVAQQTVKETKKALAESKEKENVLQKEVDSLKAQLSVVNTRTHKAEQLALQVTKDALQPYLVSSQEIELSGTVVDDGAFGNIVVAQFRGLRIAAKCLKQAADSEFQKMAFAREMYAAIHIRHPNLQQFIAASLGANVIVVTELISRSVHKELQKGPLPHNQVCCIAEDVASVLSFLHQNKPHPIIYQDISSNTVLLEPMGKNGWRAKLMENGSMKYLRYVASTPPEINCYVPPEPLDGGDPSPKADTYSFGILLIEMCTRKVPSVEPEKRGQYIQEIKWPKLASLAQACVAANPEERPTMIDVCNKMQNM